MPSAFLIGMANFGGAAPSKRFAEVFSATVTPAFAA
jgi:hypothetical protein